MSEVGVRAYARLVHDEVEAHAVDLRPRELGELAGVVAPGRAGLGLGTVLLRRAAAPAEVTH